MGMDFLIVPIAPYSKSDFELLAPALSRFAELDSEFRFRPHSDIDRTALLFADIQRIGPTLNRLTKEFGVRLEILGPEPFFRESISERVEKDIRYFDPHRHGFIQVKLRFDPSPGNGVTFTNRVPFEQLPAKFVDSIERGIRKACFEGVIFRYPVTDIAVTLEDGSFREDYSKEAAYEMMAGVSLSKVVIEGKPVLLEPIVECMLFTKEMPPPSAAAELERLGFKDANWERLADGFEARFTAPIGKILEIPESIRNQASITLKFCRLEVMSRERRARYFPQWVA